MSGGGIESKLKFGRTKSEREKRQTFRLKKLKFRKVKTWVLVVILVPLLFIDATLLRINHIRMTEIRDAVLEADKNLDEETALAKLNELKEFTLSHVVVNVVEENGEKRVTFGTGPFYLENLYGKKAREALAQAEAEMGDDSNEHGNIYQKADSVCTPQAIANGWSDTTPAYINCMVGEIQKYPAAEDLNVQLTASLPSTELFRFNFASPIWTPTLIGFCMLLTLVLVVILLVRAVIWLVLNISLLFI